MARSSLRRELPSYKRQGSLKKLIQNAIFIVVAVILFTSVIQCTLLKTISIRSISMAPAIHPGDYLVCSPFLYGKEILFSDHSFLDFSMPRRGDLVLMRPSYHLDYGLPQKLLNQMISLGTLGRSHYRPGAKMEQDWEASDIMRRVIALPGDDIYMANDRFFVRPKGKPDFQDEFTISGKTYAIKDPLVPVREHDMAFAEEMAQITVPPHMCFVSADNRDAALDSRHWGVIDISSLRGQLLFRYLPPSSFGLVR